MKACTPSLNFEICSAFFSEKLSVTSQPVNSVSARGCATGDEAPARQIGISSQRPGPRFLVDAGIRTSEVAHDVLLETLAPMIMARRLFGTNTASGHGPPGRRRSRHAEEMDIGATS